MQERAKFRRRVLLHVRQHVTLRAWMVLRAMILERAGAATGARPFYTGEERRTFADIEFNGSLEPIDGTYIWAFRYRTPQWVAHSNVMNRGLHMVSGGPGLHGRTSINAVGNPERASTQALERREKAALVRGDLAELKRLSRRRQPKNRESKGNIDFPTN